MSRPARTGRWGLAAALAVAGLLLGWWWPRAPEAPAAPSRAASVVAVEVGTPPSVPEPPARPEAGGPRLRAVLEGERPFHGEARVGAAFISEDDRLLWEVAKREGGAGPSRLEDLANVAEWRPATVTPTASGGCCWRAPRGLRRAHGCNGRKGRCSR